MLLNTAQVVLDRDNLWVAHCGHICLAYPRGETDAALIADVGRGFNILAKRVPTGIGLVIVIGERSPAPMGEVRDAAVKMFTSFGPRLRFLAACIEGTGFVAAAKRAVFTLLISRLLRDRPVKTFSHFAQAADWTESKATSLGIECPTSEELQLLLDRSATKTVR